MKNKIEEKNKIEDHDVNFTLPTLKYNLSKTKQRLKFFNQIYQKRREQRLNGQWNPVLTDYSKLIFSCPGNTEGKLNQLELRNDQNIHNYGGIGPINTLNQSKKAVQINT